MKAHFSAALGLLLLAFGSGAAKQPHKPAAPAADDSPFDHNASVHLIILATGKDSKKLERQARAMARKVRVGFNSDNPVQSIDYLCRRYSTVTINGKEAPHLSIELTDSYPGMKKGYYVIVADVCFEQKEIKKALQKYRAAAPDAYSVKTTVYMGCRQ